MSFKRLSCLKLLIYTFSERIAAENEAKRSERYIIYTPLLP